jgi:hypothetical protein
MLQGTKANYTGGQLEGFIEDTLRRNGYEYVPTLSFDEAAKAGGKPIYTRQYPIVSIYGTPLKCDFVLYHPTQYPDSLIIESKWQQSAGSVDEKFPFLVMNIREKYPCATIIVIEGGGYRKGAVEWLRKQVGERLIHVFNMSEFLQWAINNITGTRNT